MVRVNQTRGDHILLIQVQIFRRQKSVDFVFFHQVWIHGGAYISGTSTLELYDGSVLAASQSVIVVTINYRVGALAFFSTGDERISGR